MAGTAHPDTIRQPNVSRNLNGSAYYQRHHAGHDAVHAENYYGAALANSILSITPFNCIAGGHCNNVIGFYTHSPITVYEIAVSFLSHEYYKRDWTDIPFNVARYEDTTFDYTYEYARLYSYDNDSYELTVIDEKLVHI